MKEETNRFFREMQKVLTDYTRARALRYDERSVLTKEGNLEALKAWDEREEKIPRPYKPGFLAAYWMWMDCKEDDLFEVDDLPLKDEFHDFATCLKEAGVAELVITDQSTALMGCLHRFEEEGFLVKGLCKVTKQKKHWGEIQTIVNEGIVLARN